MNGESVREVIGLADFIQSRPRALTVNEVATLLSVSERQVYKLAAEHGIPYFRIGGSIRFDPVAVANWLRLKMCAAVAVSISEGGQRA